MLFFTEEQEEEARAPLATPAEAIAEWAHNVGIDCQDRAWLIHDWDVWVKNPWYQGPPVKHPEDDSDDYRDDFPPEEIAAGPAKPWIEPDDDCPF